MTKQTSAVVMVSGGLDSVTLLTYVIRADIHVHALTFSYGQRHAAELRAAERACSRLCVPQTVVAIDDAIIRGSSALTGGAPMPQGRTIDEMMVGTPPTYVPGRNTLFLAHALAFAETRGCDSIYIGVNAQDSAYPDCRIAYIKAFRDVARHGSGVQIETPFIRKTKADIVRLARLLGVDFVSTSSCYQPNSDGHPCGICDACVLRASAFAEAGVVDTLVCA